MSVFSVILASGTSFGVCLIVPVVHLKDYLVDFVYILMSFDVVRLLSNGYILLLSLLNSIISLTEVVASSDQGLF